MAGEAGDDSGHSWMGREASINSVSAQATDVDRLAMGGHQPGGPLLLLLQDFLGGVPQSGRSG